MVYEVNVTPITPKMGIQLLQFLYQVGFYKSGFAPNDFPCTTKMIDIVINDMSDAIPYLGIDERIDLSIALIAIPIQPAYDLSSKYMKNIREHDFNRVTLKMIKSTNFFENISKLHYIDEDAYAIGIISRDILEFQQCLTPRVFRDKFLEITEQISYDKYQIFKTPPKSFYNSCSK